MQFDGKVAIITGGSLGIGLAMSKAFAAEGANLVVVSNDKTQFENVKYITGVQCEVLIQTRSRCNVKLHWRNSGTGGYTGKLCRHIRTNWFDNR